MPAGISSRTWDLGQHSGRLAVFSTVHRVDDKLYLRAVVRLLSGAGAGFSLLRPKAKSEDIIKIESSKVAGPAARPLIGALRVLTVCAIAARVCAGLTLLPPLCGIFLRVRQHIICFIYFVHFSGGIRIPGMEVRVILLCLAPVGFFDLLR